VIKIDIKIKCNKYLGWRSTSATVAVSELLLGFKFRSRQGRWLDEKN
jgi:hypothetical protein